MDKVREWWFSRQGLDRICSDSVTDTVRRCGWLRSVGSANPYLAIWARSRSNRAKTEQSVAKTELIELPAARSCTYYVPIEDAAIALKLANITGGSIDGRNAERWFGYTFEDTDRLADAVIERLKDGPKAARELAQLLGDEVVNFGEEGKKRGMTTSLPLAIGRLQLQGRIRRLPQDGRLDTERYRYTIWENGPSPQQKGEIDAVRQLADRYFRWAGPATEAEFRAFAGITAKLSKEIIAMLSLVPCEERPGAFLHPEEADAYTTFKPRDTGVKLVSSLDPWLHLRRNVSTQITHSNLDVPYGKSLTSLGQLQDLDSHPISRDGRIVGLWEYDLERQEIAAWCFDGMDQATKKAIDETSQWIRNELVDFRSFSLDSAKSRIPRIEQLRKLADSR